ncbi:delta-like protein C [Haliotis asinina]|uniref:delta-like protein C n=1 Tax=Haliotis asinina TaxID=109174 RepID=UPI003531C7C8
MDALAVLWIAGRVIAVGAGPCLDNQHCFDCDNKTGHCLTDCDTGYFDLKCFSVCDGHCKGNLCNQSADGSGRCTEGCEPGYQGQRCSIPCDIPGDNCTACPGGCDGGYCQLGSSCVSGCVDSHYGTDCGNSSDGNPKLPVGLSTVTVCFILTVFLVLNWMRRQHRRRSRVTQTDVVSNNGAEMEAASVDELEWYTDHDTQRTDIVMAHESSGLNYRDGGHAAGDVADDVAGDAAGEADDVYDVADGSGRQLPTVIDNIYNKLSYV